MRLKSTRESIERGEVSFFAIVETVIATTVVVLLATYTDSLTKIAIAAIAAPFLLLRSKESAQAAGRIFWRFVPTRYYPFYHDDTHWSLVPIVFLWRDLILPISHLIQAFLFAMAARFVSIVLHPIKGLRSMPSNWHRTVLCSDVFTIAELVPGQGSASQTIEDVTDEMFVDRPLLLIYGTTVAIILILLYANTTGLIKWDDVNFQQDVTHGLIGAVMGAIPIMVPILACNFYGYLYRFSLKSTAIFWYPIVYIAKSSFGESLSLEGRLEEMREKAKWKILRLLSIVTLIVLAAKLIVIMLLPEVVDWWNSLSGTAHFEVLLQPRGINLWQLAAGVNAITTITAYVYFVNRADLYLKESVWSKSSVEKGLQALKLITGLIGLYTIAVALYLLITSAMSLEHWPQFNWDLFPKR